MNVNTKKELALVVVGVRRRTPYKKKNWKEKRKENVAFFIDGTNIEERKDKKMKDVRGNEKIGRQGTWRIQMLSKALELD